MTTKDPSQLSTNTCKDKLVPVQYEQARGDKYKHGLLCFKMVRVLLKYSPKRERNRV
jgi:hypothetical protein